MRHNRLHDNVFSAAAQKLAVFPDRLEQWRLGNPVTPIAVEIQPSERCNHDCPDCQARYGLGALGARALRRAGTFLDLRLLSSLWESPPAGVIISGNSGDPLLHAELKSLMTTLASHDVPTVLITNLQALSADIADEILRTCLGVRISLDASDADEFRRRHGKRAQWSTVIDNIGVLVDRKRSGLSARGCHLGVGYLTDKRSASGMVAATRLARDLGVDYIQFRPYHFHFEDVSGELAACRQLSTAEFQVYDSSQKYSRLHEVSRSYTRCHGANFYAVIDAKADVYMCCHHVGNPNARYGSLKESSWHDILRSSRRRDVLARLDTQSCVPLCRLHAHNEWLQARADGGSLMPIPTGIIRQHAPFL